MTAPTIGMITDLHTTQGLAALAKALQDFPNKDFHSGAKSAVEFKYKFLVVAGRLDHLNEGVVQALAHDEAAALVCLVTINRRMGEAGASSTRWIIAGDPGFQQRASKAALSYGEGAP